VRALQSTADLNPIVHTAARMQETVRQQLRGQVRRITLGFVAIMLIGFAAVLFSSGTNAGVIESPLWVLVSVIAVIYVYRMRCRCPRCRKGIAGIYGKVPPRCPWCGLDFEAPFP
jgi:uncharacterized protein (DUF983 family)